MSPFSPSHAWRRVSSHDGTDIAWRVDGPDAALTRAGTVRSGRVAVVLCNGIACDETYYERLWEDLAGDVPVVRWHYRGHGYSQAPVNHDEITVSSVVRDLHAVMEAARVRKAVLVGHSYGVQVVCEAYRDHHESIVGLVAVAGAYGSPLGTIFGANPGRHVFDLLRAVLSPPPASLLFRTVLRSPIAYPAVKAARFISASAPPEHMRVWFEHLADRDMGLILRMMRCMQEHTSEDLLPTIEVPTVAIAGGADWATPPRLAERMVDLLPDGRLVVIPEATHVLPLEYPKAVVAEVRHLLQELGALPG